MPEDDRVFEKTKRRICCAVPADAETSSSASPAKRTVTKFEKPESGFMESGLPVATLEVGRDNVSRKMLFWEALL